MEVIPFYEKKSHGAANSCTLSKDSFAFLNNKTMFF